MKAIQDPRVQISRTGEQETAVERYAISPDLLLYRSTALFLLRKNRSDKTPVELFVRFCAEDARCFVSAAGLL